MTSGPVPGPRPGPPATEPGPSPDEASTTAHPELVEALAALEADLPDLPLAQHHDRYAAVLEHLHRVMDDARDPG